MLDLLSFYFFTLLLFYSFILQSGDGDAVPAGTADGNEKRQLRIGVAFLHVVLGGFEPPQTEPKPVVLPLHHRTICGAKLLLLFKTSKFCTVFFIVLPPLPALCSVLSAGLQSRIPLLHGDEVIVLLSALDEEVFAVDKVVGCHGTVERGEFLLVERHTTALYELAHLTL